MEGSGYFRLSGGYKQRGGKMGLKRGQTLAPVLATTKNGLRPKRWNYRKKVTKTGPILDLRLVNNKNGLQPKL